MQYQLIRSSRKTIAIQVKASGEVIVRIPMRCSQAAAEAFVREKQEWIMRQLEVCQQRQIKQEAKIQQGEIRPQPETEAECQAYRKTAAAVIAKKAAFYADQMQVNYGKITIREQKTRWGSCSSKGNLNFNWRLLLAPEPVLDYVVVHELAHRKEMNHSSRFWSEVAAVMPDYQRWRTWLREYGACLNQ